MSILCQTFYFMNQLIKKLTKYCIDNLDDLSNLDKKAPEYNYSCVALCAIDSVYSIGVRYEGVQNVISHFCQKTAIPEKSKRRGSFSRPEFQTPTFKILSILNAYSSTELAEKMFNNKQRTSVKNGILKAEATKRFISVLNDFDIQYFSDIARLENNESFEVCIKSIPGQKSGISLKYFLMLAGNDKLIKPDRMILRFLEAALGTRINIVDAHSMLVEATNELKNIGFNVSPKALDRIIWDYQRTL